MLDKINQWTWKKTSDGIWFDNEVFETKEEAILDAKNNLKIFCEVGQLVKSNSKDYLYDVINIETFYS